MEHPSFTELFTKYINDGCTPEEVDQLMAILEDETQHVAGKELLREYMLGNLVPGGDHDAVLRERLDQRFQQIQQHIQTAERRGGKVTRLFWQRMAAASVIVLLLGAATWFLLKRENKPAPVARTLPQGDIAPGGNKATLRLADGRTIVLDNASNGMLEQQGASKVNKENGKIVYSVVPNLSESHGSVTYNILSTPKGGQYQLVLPDGSQVWLNAASSIRFPTAFTGNERKVVISGEAYFEVKPMKQEGSHEKMPFIVQVERSLGVAEEITVLGTHFNINSYEDEPVIATTLLEGRVRVSKPGQQATVVLQPGEQAQLNSSNSNIGLVKNPNLNQVMAWKNGLFVFDGVDLKTVMRQLARWYNVDIAYETGAPVSDIYNGAMQRNLTLLQIMKGLDGMDVHVRKEGNKLIVTP